MIEFKITRGADGAFGIVLPPAPEDRREAMRHAAHAFAYLVPRGYTMTGAQFAAAIRQACSHPRALADADVLEGIMHAVHMATGEVVRGVGYSCPWQFLGYLQFARDNGPDAERWRAEDAQRDGFEPTPLELSASAPAVGHLCGSWHMRKDGGVPPWAVSVPLVEVANGAQG